MLAAGADFVDMVEQIRRVLIDTVRTGALELILAVAARQETNAQGAGALSGQHVPDAVADHGRAPDWNTQPIGSGEEQVRIRLGELHLVSSHDRGPDDVDTERFEGRSGTRHPP